MTDYLKNLFTERREIVLNKGEKLPDSAALTAAVTANENLRTLGYTLKATDIVTLAQSDRLNTLYDEVKAYIGEVKAEPMYPDFPNQVMEMSEAQYRFHQLLHYFFTYGLEYLTGGEVLRGWLPDAERTEKIREDETLLEAKVLSVLSEEDMYTTPLIDILSRRQRMTNIEKRSFPMRWVKRIPMF